MCEKVMRFVLRQPSLSIASRHVVRKGSSTATGANDSVSPPWCVRPDERFPVHRIYCVARNYREHAIEMGGDPDRELPFFFQKPADACIDATDAGSVSGGWEASEGRKDGGSDHRCLIPYPPQTSNLHHEVELVVAIGKEGRNIPADRAEDHIFGYAVGCDLTRRDLQAEAKKTGRPWDASKGFDFSAPCAAVVPKNDAELPPSETSISLEVNGKLRQESTLDMLTWNIPETLSFLSQYYKLMPGDLVMTGTPAGVGPLQVGDVVRATCGDLPPCIFEIGPEESS